MGNIQRTFLDSIPASKYYAPEIHPGRHIQRHRLVNTLHHRQLDRKKIILVEAQAGQGKSVFSAQLVQTLEAPFVWYQLGHEDGEIPYFVTGLLCAIAQKFPGFSVPLLEKILTSGEVQLHTPKQLATLFCEGLVKLPAAPLYLVLDDVYLLDGYQQSLAFLAELLEKTTEKIRFILISRHPVEPAINNALPLANALRIRNSFLALSKREIGEFFHQVLALPVSRKTVQNLHEITEGWMMGIILLGQTLQEHPQGYGASALDSLIKDPGKSIFDYFHDNVLSRFPENIHRLILKTSLLNRIPVSLASALGEVSDPGAVFRHLSEQNYFLRPLDRDQSEFVYHHLFGDCLRDHARNLLSQAEIDAVHLAAARWHLGQDELSEALHHFLAARDYTSTENVMKDVGIRLQANNRLMLLHEALSRIPEEVIREHAWLSYFLGIAKLDHDPFPARDRLHHAMELFKASGDEFGEMLVMTQLLHFHVLISTEFNQGAPFLERLETLFPKLLDELDLHLKVQSAYALAAGHIWITCDLKASDHYSTMALQWARQADMENFLGGLATVRVCRWILESDFRAGMRESDEFASLMKSERVSEIHKCLMFGVWVNQLEMDGDFANYEHQKGVLMQRIRENVLVHSVIGPMLILWDCDVALARGDLVRALALAREGLRSDGTAAMPHMRSMFFHYYALILALQGRREEARDAIRESLQLRDAVGGKLFVALNRMFVAAAHVFLDHDAEAERRLATAIELCEEIGQDYTQIAVHAYRAWLRGKRNGDEAALEDARAAVDLLHKNGYHHVFAWHPDIMGYSLALAYRYRHQRDFVLGLAADKLHKGIRDDGELVDMIEVQDLGPVQMRLGNQAILDATDLTDTQRALLGLLLISPDRQRRQEELQEHLWPEESAGKSRGSFDTLLARLRSRLDEKWGKGTGKNYLTLQGGILALRHARTDSERFQVQVRQGLEFARQGSLWQAGNRMRDAERLWRGPFLENLASDPTIEAMRGRFSRLHAEMSLVWTEVLVRNGDLGDAVRVAEAGFSENPSDEDLARQIYDLYIDQDDLQKGKTIVDKYRQSLQDLGHSSFEIDELLEAFWE